MPCCSGFYSAKQTRYEAEERTHALLVIPAKAGIYFFHGHRPWSV
jgi:hypothetical protein